MAFTTAGYHRCYYSWIPQVLLQLGTTGVTTAGYHRCYYSWVPQVLLQLGTTGVTVYTCIQLGTIYYSHYTPKNCADSFHRHILYKCTHSSYIPASSAKGHACFSTHFHKESTCYTFDLCEVCRNWHIAVPCSCG